MLTADQLLARLRDPQRLCRRPGGRDVPTLHHAFMFISYNMSEFRDYVEKEQEKEEKE